VTIWSCALICDVSTSSMQRDTSRHGRLGIVLSCGGFQSHVVASWRCRQPWRYSWSQRGKTSWRWWSHS
jgi:hypothetical protein